MSLWLQKSYLNRLSGTLRNFKWKTGDLLNCSCPLCGDSTTDKRKARGFFYTATDKDSFQKAYFYKCHNCHVALPFTAFLKRYSQVLYDEYKLEAFKDKPQPLTKEEPKEELKAEEVKLNTVSLIPVKELLLDHEALAYLHSRKLTKLSEFFWAPDFTVAIRDLAPNLKIATRSTPRICLLLKDKTGQPYGIIGRQINHEEDPLFRYITIKFDRDAPKIFGLDRLNTARSTFLVEGPIDSLYLPNTVALCGGSLSLDILEQHLNKDKTIVALDNEPRKKETVENIIKFAEAGWKVVVWKGMSSSYKDISDMICKGGLSVRELLSFMSDNTYSGLSAIQEINNWKRI